MVEKQKNLSEAVEETIRLEERLIKVRNSGSTKSLSGRGMLAKAEGDLAESKAIEEALIDNYSNLDAKPLLAGLKKARADAAGLNDTALVEHINKQIAGMALLALESTSTAEEIFKVLNPPSSAETISGLLESMNAGLGGFSEGLAKMSEKVATPFDKMSEGLDEAIAALSQTKTYIDPDGFGSGSFITELTDEALNLREKVDDVNSPLGKMMAQFAGEGE